MEWYQNIVTNPEALVSPPTSWRQLFEDDLYKGKIGLIGLYDGGMIEVVAKTYFDGNETLNTRAGIRAVIEKVGALKEQVGFWWTAESQMEQAIRSQNVIAGSFFHDVALLLKEDNFPIASTFPLEGSFTGVNKLCIPPHQSEFKTQRCSSTFAPDRITKPDLLEKCALLRSSLKRELV